MTLVAVSNTSNGGDHDDDGGRHQLQVEAEMVIYLFVCCLWLEQGHGGLGRDSDSGQYSSSLYSYIKESLTGYTLI